MYFFVLLHCACKVIHWKKNHSVYVEIYEPNPELCSSWVMNTHSDSHVVSCKNGDSFNTAALQMSSLSLSLSLIHTHILNLLPFLSFFDYFSEHLSFFGVLCVKSCQICLFHLIISIISLRTHVWHLSQVSTRLLWPVLWVVLFQFRAGTRGSLPWHVRWL